MNTSLEEKIISRERSIFANKLFSISKNNLSPDVSDLRILFNYYKTSSNFTKQSLKTLLKEFLLSRNFLSIITDEQISNIFSNVLHLNRDMSEDSFITLFSRDFSLLYKTVEFLDLENNYIKFENKFLLIQCFLPYNKIDKQELINLINEKFSSLVRDNKILKTIVVENPILETFDVLISFETPIDFFEFSPIYSFPFSNGKRDESRSEEKEDGKEGETNPNKKITVHCKVYESEKLPLENRIYKEENVFNLINKKGKEITEQLKIRENFSKGKDFMSEKFVQIKENEMVKNTTEGISGFFGGLKNKITGTFNDKNNGNDVK